MLGDGIKACFLGCGSVAAFALQKGRIIEDNLDLVEQSQLKCGSPLAILPFGVCTVANGKGSTDKVVGALYYFGRDKSARMVMCFPGFWQCLLVTGMFEWVAPQHFGMGTVLYLEARSKLLTTS